MTTPYTGTFTLDLIGWAPWIDRATDTDLAPEIRQRTENYVTAQRNSDYNNVLANDLETALTRQIVHHHKYTVEDDEHGANRELAATTTSRINGCIFCASVHARMFATFSGDRGLIERFLTDGVDTELPAKERAIVDVAAKLTRDPEALSGSDLQPLRDLGFANDEIFDVINYAAFFANANRLMLTLGEPTEPRR
jgi:uncharacterized peroxidase-related enzyme